MHNELIRKFVTNNLISPLKKYLIHIKNLSNNLNIKMYLENYYYGQCR